MSIEYCESATSMEILAIDDRVRCRNLARRFAQRRSRRPDRSDWTQCARGPGEILEVFDTQENLIDRWQLRRYTLNDARYSRLPKSLSSTL